MSGKEITMNFTSIRSSPWQLLIKICSILGGRKWEKVRRDRDCEFNATPASHYRSSRCSPTVRQGDDSRLSLGPLENRPKPSDSCDNSVVVDRAGRIIPRAFSAVGIYWSKIGFREWIGLHSVRTWLPEFVASSASQRTQSGFARRTLLFHPLDRACN